MKMSMAKFDTSTTFHAIDLINHVRDGKLVFHPQWAAKAKKPSKERASACLNHLLRGFPIQSLWVWKQGKQLVLIGGCRVVNTIYKSLDWKGSSPLIFNPQSSAIEEGENEFAISTNDLLNPRKRTKLMQNLTEKGFDHYAGNIQQAAILLMDYPIYYQTIFCSKEEADHLMGLHDD